MEVSGLVIGALLQDQQLLIACGQGLGGGQLQPEEPLR